MEFDHLFRRRMQYLLKDHESAGNVIADQTNVVIDTTFKNDPNYRRGYIYDWNMKALDTVDFKFQKVNERTLEKMEVAYFVQFKTDFYPEIKYASHYYRPDGRTRYGFYLDVPNYDTKRTEKWMLLEKDERTRLQRYFVMRCNWCFEWVGSDGEYHYSLGCLRDSEDNNTYTSKKESLGGSSVNGDLDLFLPTSEAVKTIKTGTRIMITDNEKDPACYEVIKVKDTMPLGVSKLYCEQSLYNEHTDFVGVINKQDKSKFRIGFPVKDLPPEYGTDYHYLCDCLARNAIVQEDDETCYHKRIESTQGFIKYNGKPVIVSCTGFKEDEQIPYHFFLDDKEYQEEELSEYFEIIEEFGKLSIRAISRDVVNYVLKISIYNKKQSYKDSVEMEVKF